MEADIDLSEKVSALDLSGAVTNAEVDTGYFCFLELPIVVHDKILDYLNIWNLMDLRLVCKRTKKLVDAGNLDKFALHVRNHNQMEDSSFQACDTPWSNIVILCDANVNDPNWIQNPLYSQLLKKLSSSLTALKLEDHRLPYSGLLSILSTCKSLQRFEIGTLDCRGWSVDSTAGDIITLSLGVAQLQSLSIGYFAWDKEDDLDILKLIFAHCTKLEYLKAPHILMASLFQIGDTDDEEADRRYLKLVKERLIYPLEEFVKSRKIDAETEKYDNVEKEMPSLDFLDVENLHHSEIFPGVAFACYASGTKLLNVAEAYEKAIPMIEQPFVKTIESLNGFTSHLNFHELINLKSIALDSETSADSDIDIKSVDAKMSKLKSISFCLPEDISPNILKCLLQQNRPSVTSLSIEFQVEGPQLFQLFQVSDVVQSFKNLRELAFLEWGGKDDDLIVIFNDLTTLRSLRLQSCGHITDRGFLGSNPAEPVMLKLKDLKHIWIDCQISNAVLKYAIRHMELESFFYSSERVNLAGFLSLTQGPLTTSLICLPVIQPDECTAEILQRFKSYFKNLKRGPISGAVEYVE